MKTYKHWSILESLPKDWKIDKTSGSPLAGHTFVTDCKSILNGGKRALLCVRKQPELNFGLPAPTNIRPITNSTPPKQSTKFAFDACHARTVNELARQKFKRLMLNDILVDLTICEIEGWVKIEYINELRGLINGLARDVTITNAA